MRTQFAASKTNLLGVSNGGKARPTDIRTVREVVHQILRSRELLEKSRIAHARLEGGRSNRRSHDDEMLRAMEKPRKKKRKRGD